MKFSHRHTQTNTDFDFSQSALRTQRNVFKIKNSRALRSLRAIIFLPEGHYRHRFLISHRAHVGRRGFRFIVKNISVFPVLSVRYGFLPVGHDYE